MVVACLALFDSDNSDKYVILRAYFFCCCCCCFGTIDNGSAYEIRNKAVVTHKHTQLPHRNYLHKYYRYDTANT